MNTQIKTIEEQYLIFYGKMPDKEKKEYLRRLCLQLGLEENSPTMIDIIANDALNQKLIEFPKKFEQAMDKVETSLYLSRDHLVDKLEAEAKSRLNEYREEQEAILAANIANLLAQHRDSVKVDKWLGFSLTTIVISFLLVIGVFVGIHWQTIKNAIGGLYVH